MQSYAPESTLLLHPDFFCDDPPLVETNNYSAELFASREEAFLCLFASREESSRFGFVSTGLEIKV